MTSVTVKCDSCGKIMPSEEAYWYVGNEQDLCALCFLKQTKEDLLQQISDLQEQIDLRVNQRLEVEKQLLETESNKEYLSLQRELEDIKRIERGY